ncbi:MAG: transcriptional regulator FilR1 domain-containing protein [Candidatus Methanoperedens sp.]
MVESNKNLPQLREITGSGSQALIPIIRKLESIHLLEKKNNEYQLTSLGRVIASKIANFSRALGAINLHSYFWTNHYMEGIPATLLNEIGDLFDSEIISDTNVNLFNVYTNYLKIVKEARHISGVTSVMSPGHADVIGERIIEGIPVELIVSSDVALQLKEEPYSGKINALADYKNFKLMVIYENIKVGLTVTDGCVSLGLYKKDGVTYDTTTDLFSFDRRAIEWGERLFEYYRQRSRILRIKDIFDQG